jgi:exoribonuclease II
MLSTVEGFDELRSKCEKIKKEGIVSDMERYNSYNSISDEYAKIQKSHK